jgi:hypothetical protein
MLDTLANIADDRIERMTMLNADTSFLLLEEGCKTEAVQISNHVGGGAVNAAVALSRLGLDVAALVKLGRDQRAETVLGHLMGEGISTRWVLRDERAPTGASVLVSSHDRDAAIFTFRGANTLLDESDLHDDAFAVDVVYVSSLSNESADTFPAIGAQGFDVFVASRTGTLTELAPNLARYRAAYASAGHAGKGGVYLRVPVYVADTFDRAVEDCRESILAFYRQLGEQMERSAQDAGARAIEQRDVRGRRLREASFDEVLRERVIVGSPEMVTERLGKIAAELELDGILAELNCGGQVPRDGVINSLRLLCNEVIPAFK